MSQPDRYSTIIGCGTYLPERLLTNKDLESFVDTSDEWIQKRTGVTQRHLCTEGQGTAQMAVEAARKALLDADMSANDIGMVVVGTHYPDYSTPSVACLVQSELGINNGGPAFDLNAACSGFVYSMTVADQMIRGGMANNALVIGVDRLSQVIQWDDRSTCVLFGDGAGAVVLKADDQPGLIAADLKADGTVWDVVYITNGNPVNEALEQANRIFMRGNELFKHAVGKMSSVIESTLAKANMNAEQIDWVIPHQANIRIMNATAKKVGLSEDKVIATVGQHANTSAASIPLAMRVAMDDERIKPGDTLLLVAIGGGLSWGACIVQLPQT